MSVPAVVLEVDGLDGLLGQKVSDPLVGADPGAADGAPVALRPVGAALNRKVDQSDHLSYDKDLEI